MDKNLITEFDAAILVGLSPTFLRWCTSYAPKSDGVKLRCTRKGELYYFDKQELLDFDTHLKAPWTKPANGQRPNIPTGIEQEIKSEALYQCPVCNRTQGEIAHINPVSIHLDNHPHNLIFLCPNHHTEYDYGYRIANVDKDDVLHFKKGLQIFQRIIWELRRKTIESYLSLVSKIGKVLEIESQIKSISGADVEKLLSQIFQKIEVAKENKEESKEITEVLEATKIEKKATIREKAQQYLSTRESYTDKLIKAKKIKECPLCNGQGNTTDFEVCPVCRGEGYIDYNDEPDLSRYDFEECPLCDGRGSTSYFETCPPCGGEGKLTQELIDTIDFTRFDLVECELCEGAGRTANYDPCPPCHGEGMLAKEQVDLIDFEKYRMIDCPLCEGDGNTSHFETCPVCHGEGNLSKELADGVDLDRFKLVDCPLCEGGGSTSDFETCPVCEGDGCLTQEQYEKVDISHYEMLNCPACNGFGSDQNNRTCRICGGSGELTREQLERSGFDDE